MGIKVRKVTEKIIGIFLDILIILFGFILLVFIYNNIQTKIFKNDYSSIFGFSTFEVVTGSMEGNLEDSISAGDWVIVKYTNNIQIKDIITYQKDNSFITHRVVQEYNGNYITKGDANNTNDDPVSREQVVGKVVKILPNFGIIRKTILNPYVLISLIVSFYLIGYALRSIKKDREKIKTKKITEKVDAAVTNVLDKVFDSKSEEKPKRESVKDKYDFIETEIDVSRKVKDELDEFEDDDDTPIEEVDIEQTMYFRMVSVNKKDIEYLDAQKTSDEIIDEETLTDEEAEVAHEDEVKTCLEFLNTRKKKFKNIIDKVMYIKKDELESILNVLNGKEKLKQNEKSIIDKLINAYVDEKYYSFDIDSRKSIIVRIDNALKEIATKMNKEYKGNDNLYSEKVKKYVKFLMLCNDLEQIDKLFDNIQARRENYNNKLLATFKSDISGIAELKVMVNSIIKIKKIHESVTNEVLKNMESNTFELEIQEIKSKLNGVKLIHNINFSKVYSDFIIDKTYSEGIIAEDKLLILVSLLLTKIIKDVLTGENKTKYLVHLPESMFKKTNKFEKIFNMLDDELAKESIIFFNNYEDVVNNKRIIKTLRKNGYHFAVNFTENSSVKAKDASFISVFEYIFATPRVLTETNVNEYLTDEDKANLIKEDIYNKIIN